MIEQYFKQYFDKPTKVNKDPEKGVIVVEIEWNIAIRNDFLSKIKEHFKASDVVYQCFWVCSGYSDDDDFGGYYISQFTIFTNKLEKL